MRGYFPTDLMRFNITQIPKPNENTTKKRNYRAMNINENILIKILANPAINKGIIHHDKVFKIEFTFVNLSM